MKENKTHLFVNNYGELLAQVNDLELISFEEDGGYQGDYCAVLTDGKKLYYYVDSYGSCSGCDWLEDKGNSYMTSDEISKEADKLGKSYVVDYKEALEFCGGIKPAFIVPKEKPLTITNKGEYEGFQLS